MAIITPWTTLSMLFHCILTCRRRMLCKKEFHELAQIQINSDLDAAGDWVDFIPCSAPTHSFRSIQECQMGLGNVVLVQGRELKVETLLKWGPWGKWFRKLNPVAKKHRKATFFFFFLQRSGRENANKTNLVLYKIKTPHLSYVWVWKWSWHILTALESSRGKPVTSKRSQIRDTTQAPVRHTFKNPP